MVSVSVSQNLETFTKSPYISWQYSKGIFIPVYQDISKQIDCVTKAISVCQ